MISLSRRQGIFFLLAAMLLLLPVAGVWLAGYPVARYLEFPPRTRYVVPAPFSWPVFLGFLAFGLAVLFPILLRLWRVRKGGDRPLPGRFPWWGWLGVVLGAGSWFLAWTRFPWFAPWQPHTFTPLWLAYVLVVNALVYRRTGGCLMTSRPRYFLSLFAWSAGFWWFFEYLNRFVQNWYYPAVRDFSGLEYFVFATLPFSTVLPAVLRIGKTNAVLREKAREEHEKKPGRKPILPQKNTPAQRISDHNPGGLGGVVGGNRGKAPSGSGILPPLPRPSPPLLYHQGGRGG